ncbi:MAG: hydantoinase B/oxoprolinase family protein [Planctomycetota bacterium]
MTTGDPAGALPLSSSDRLRLDVFHHLFASIAEEMGACLQRSSFSPNIRERRDFSCALFDREGRMIGQAAHLPVHLGSCPRSVEAARAAVELGPGDAVLLNDPFQGGTHLPDLTLVSPVFLPGDETPSFFVANRAHHADVGGAFPGSMAPALDVHGEGVRVPPIHLVRNGVIERDVLRLLLANMRVPEEREGDLLAQWSTNRLGVERLTALAEEFGAEEARRRGDELIAWTSELTDALLASWPARFDVAFEDELESAAGSFAIRLRVSREKKRVRFDFSATDAAPGSHLNAPLAVAESAVFYCLRALLPAGTPTNAGCLAAIDIVTRPGTLVDARYPASVAAGNVETSQRIVDTILGALVQLEPERIPAASAGTMSNLTFAGERGDGERYTYYETIPGGAGAGPLRRGASMVQTHMTNTRNTPIEEFELLYPARVVALERRRGSGGPGRHAGGDGLRRTLRFLRAVDVAWIAQRQSKGPWGLGGGAPGCSGRARWRAGGTDRWHQLEGAVRLEAGAELRIETPGGGGWGEPAATGPASPPQGS